MTLQVGEGVATMHWSLAGGPTDISVTMGFDATAVTDPNTCAAAIESYLTSGTGPCSPARMTVGWKFTGVSILANPSGLLFSGLSYSNTAGTGVDSAPAVPSYTPYIVTKRTAAAGVRYRGRMYPPFTQADAETIDGNGVIESINLGVLQSAWDDTFALWNGAAYPPLLLHGVSTAHPTPLAGTPLSSLQVQPIVGIQRRRKAR